MDQLDQVRVKSGLGHGFDNISSGQIVSSQVNFWSDQIDTCHNMLFGYWFFPPSYIFLIWHFCFVSDRIGYTSVYGELPEYDMKRDDISEIPFMPSERPWETIFTGSSHNLPPLTKLCSTFLESLLEKRSTVTEWKIWSYSITREFYDPHQSKTFIQVLICSDKSSLKYF